ncbi:SNF2 family N-terminal domain-containing protein [Auriculariales sp. MPI-PUGE-AT-0066]|nr:SNF2 family N-terminal domain-containing protein [Auriculariales sp. MPI-PUGE-AT-0066]
MRRGGYYRGRGTQTLASTSGGNSSGVSMRVSSGSKPKHLVEYAKSSRSSCKAQSCNLGPIQQGELRYGILSVTAYGETYQYRHWRTQCITKNVLNILQSVGANKIGGFYSLKIEDQARIRGDIAAGRVRGPEERTQAEGGTMVPAQSGLQRVATGSKRPLPATDEMTATSSATAAAKGYEYPFDQEVDVEQAEPEPESEPVDEIYVRYQANVVGISYYNGMVCDEERVEIARDARNRHDPNAFQVKNMLNEQVGHLKREVAARLAPLYDVGHVQLEGTVLKGNMGGILGYSLPLELRIIGRSDRRSSLEQMLLWATPRGFSDAMRTAEYTGNPARAIQSAASQAAAASTAGGSAQIQARIAEIQKARELATMLQGLDKVDDEGRRASALDALCGIGENDKDLLKLPELDASRLPSGLLSTLLPHQSQALRWCLEKEHPQLPKQPADKAVQFWQYKKSGNKPFYYNVAAHTPLAMNTPPVLGRGGLIADAMGLGKTLTMLSLILATKDEPSLPGYSKATLIVVPLSVISNWEQQISEHIVKGKLKSHVYYGNGRDAKPSLLENRDIVITTYQVVASEYQNFLAENATNEGASGSRKKKKYDGGLIGVKWRRVILDEGHTVRNPKTQQAKAVFALDAERRWVVSGTPIINGPKDLGSLLRFLRLCTPLDREDYFKSLLIRPLAGGSPEGVAILRTLMSQICLRRTKEMQRDDGSHLVELPPVRMTVVPVSLPEDVRQLYDEIEDLSRQRFENMLERQRVQGGQNVMATSNVLGMLTRLRQLVLHPGLVPRNYLEQLRAGVAATINNEGGQDRVEQLSVSPEDKTRLQALLAQAIEESEECPVCFEVLREPRITPCAHMFCLVCIAEVIRRDTRCPMDRRTLSMNDIIDPPPQIEATQRWPTDAEDDDDDMDVSRAGASAKIEQLIALLELQPRSDKSLVFSQFTGFLDKIGDALHVAGIPYLRLDGKMSAKRRAEVIRQFSIPLPSSSRVTKQPKLEEIVAAAAAASAAPLEAETILTGFQTPDDSVVASQASHSSTNSAVASQTSHASVPGSAAGALATSSSRPTHATRAKSKKMVVEDSDDEDGADEPIAEPEDDGTDGEYQDNYADGPEAEPADFFGEKSDEEYVGKGKAKATAKSTGTVNTPQSYIRTLDGSRVANAPVLLISLKAGALGLNLTVANNVFLMDPWWQEGIESQAIDRCNRIGQTKDVNVYQLVAEHTVEQKVLDIQNRKKKLISDAFSGFKSKETPTEKRETRMAELRELLGSRRRAQEEGS